MQRQDGELDLPGPSAQPRRTVLLQKQAPARYLSCTSGGTRVSDGTLTPADLIPGYLGTDQLYLRVFALTRRYLAGDRQYLFV